MAPTLGGGTQDTDLNKGFTKGNFTKNIFGEEMGGVRGTQTPSLFLIRSPTSRPLEGNRALFRKIHFYRPPSNTPVPPLKIQIFVEDFPYDCFAQLVAYFEEKAAL